MDIHKTSVYKVHIFDASGVVKKIHVFCGGTKNESHLRELFSDIELALHETNEVEYVFSEQLIHYDESIRTLKKKIVQDIGKDRVSYKELYLFGFFESRVDIKEIYNELTENESTELTHAKLTQVALNINVSDAAISKLDLEQDVFSYDDFMELRPEGGISIANKPIGIQFHNKYDFLFSANPFHINSLHANLFEISPKNQLLAFENHLILTYGKMESNNIFACLAEQVFDFASMNNLEHKQLCELYYPALYVDGIHTKEDLLKDKSGLLKETAASLKPSTLKYYKTVDMFYEIFWNKSEDLAYLERGISKYSVTMKSSNEDHPFPLDVLFKNVHSTKEMPFIKYNPGKNRENMYRLFSEKLAKNGKKIPALKESVIMKLKRELGKSNMISIYLLHDYKGRKYSVNVFFDSNAKIRMEGELYPPLLQDDLADFLKTAINPIIQMIKNYLYSSGYVLQPFKSLVDENIESSNFKYVAVYPIEKRVDLTKMLGCINSVFDVIETDVKEGAKLRFKRVENFKEMEAQDALIMETYKRTNDPREVVVTLMDAYQLSEQEAEMRFAQYSSTHAQLNGKFLENPGFPVSIKMVPFKNNVLMEVDEITSIEYIQVLHVYLDSILRNSQGLIQADLQEKVNDICSKSAKAIEVKDNFGDDSVVTAKETAPIFTLQPLKFGKNEEELDDDDDPRGIYFDDDEFDYEEEDEEEDEVEEEGEEEDEGDEGEEEKEDEDEEEVKGGMDQQYPPGTQEKYNSFHSRIPVMEGGLKTGITEIRGGGKGLESSEAGFGRPGVPPRMDQQYPPGTQEKYNSFHSRIPVMEGGLKTGITEIRGGGKGEQGVPPRMDRKGLDSSKAGRPADYAPDIDGTSLKYPNIFQRKLSERDPSLFLTEKQGKYKLYSRTCPVKRQPVILTDAEKKRIDETSPGSYEHAIQYGSDPANPYWYICPRYWCLKTNSSITEEEVKSGKCGNIIPAGATTVPKGAYVYEFTDKDHIDQNGNYQKHIPSFLDSGLHPDGLCIPCCFKKSWDSKQHRELRDKCSQDGKATPREVDTSKYNPHVMSSVTSPLDQNRRAFLPMALQYFLGIDNNLAVDKKKPSQIKVGGATVLRYGIEKHDRQSFLGCVAYYYGYKHNLEKAPSIIEMRDILAESITLDMFLKYHNGNLVNIFRPNVIEQAQVDVDKHMSSEFAKTIDLNNEAQLDFLEETISSYDAFIEYLTNDSSEIDYTYLWDIISDVNPKIMPKGLNLVILDLVNADGTDNVHLVCPSNSYSGIQYNPGKETAIIMKSGEYYDPLQYYHVQTNVDILIKKTFFEGDALKNIKHILELIKQSTKKYCHPLASQPKVYKFEQNIVATNLAAILRSYNFNIGSQIVNYNKKVIGLCVNKEEGQNFVYIPCHPSGIMDGLKIRYIDDDGLWLDYVTTRDRLIGIHMDTSGKVKCLPKVKIIEDKLVVGFLTSTNQFIQINPPAQDIYQDGLETIEHFDYPIRSNVDKTLALNKSGDQKRIQAIHNISVESDFYNAFRSVVRMELNDYNNRAVKRQITDVLENGGILYGAKLIKVDALLRQLTKDSISFQAFDQKTVDAFRNISMCHSNENGSCEKNSDKKYCLSTENGCKTIFPKRHLVSGVDNEKVYYGRMADELVRYRRIRMFMFQTKSYLNISYSEYQIDSSEMFILDTLLTKDYFSDLVPHNLNKNIQNIQYDDAQPEITRNYDNEVSLSEQFALVQPASKLTGMDDYISSCIKETVPRVIGNEKSGSWRIVFPSTAKEIVFENTVACSYIPIIYILQKFTNKPASIQNIKTVLWNGYSTLLDLHRDKILALLRAHGKRTLIELVLSKKSTLEHVIFSDDYYITDLDIWVICKMTQLPIILFSSTTLKYLSGAVDWIRMGTGRSEPNEKYYFIRSPAKVAPNQPPAYQLISQAYSFSDLKNDVFTKADRGDPTYADNLITVDTFLSKFHLISKAKPTED